MDRFTAGNEVTEKATNQVTQKIQELKVQTKETEEYPNHKTHRDSELSVRLQIDSVESETSIEERKRSPKYDTDTVNSPYTREGPRKKLATFVPKRKKIRPND